MKNGDKPANPTIADLTGDKNGTYLSESATQNGVMFYGLTKREMFAMAAMQGLLSNAPFVQSLGHYNLDHKALINVAVGVADELLKQLEK